MSNNQAVMKFHSDAVKDNTLLVATAEGLEVLATPFHFEMDLVSDDPGLDLAALLNAHACLSLNRTMDLGDGRSGDIAYDYHGLVTEFRQIERVGNNRYRYRAVLRSHLWKLACTRRSRIFTDKSVPDILALILDEMGIPHRFILADKSTYPINPYIVQYEESDLDFISRWIEYVGISYYYEAKGDIGTIVIIDNAKGYCPISDFDKNVLFDVLPESAGRVYSVAHAAALQFIVTHLETRIPFDGQPDHCDPVRIRRDKLAVLQRWHRHGHEDQFVQARLLKRILRGKQVPEVDGVEAAPEKTDLHAVPLLCCAGAPRARRFPPMGSAPNLCG
jgi:hypothetical protein